MTHEKNTVPLISDQLLADYADGCLDNQTERRVEALISNDPHLRTKILDLIALRQAVRADVSERAGMPEHPETIKLVKELDKALRPPKRWRFGKISTGLAAAAAMLVIGTVYWPDYSQNMRGMQRAAVDSLLSPSPKSDITAAGAPLSSTVDATAEAESVNATSSRADQQKPELVPDFSTFGFELVETRLVNGEAGDTVHLLYETTDGQRVSLYYGGTQNARNQQVTV